MCISWDKKKGLDIINAHNIREDLALNFRSYSTEHIFYGVGLSIPILKHQNIPLCLGHHFDLSGIRYPTKFYTTATIALRIIWPYTLHHCIKQGKVTVTLRNMSPSDFAMSAILLPHQENVLLSIRCNMGPNNNDLHSNINVLNFPNKAEIIIPLQALHICTPGHHPWHFKESPLENITDYSIYFNIIFNFNTCCKF